MSKDTQMRSDKYLNVFSILILHKNNKLCYKAQSMTSFLW